jgi:hypothetical protein
MGGAGGRPTHRPLHIAVLANNAGSAGRLLIARTRGQFLFRSNVVRDTPPNRDDGRPWNVPELG